MSRRRGAGRRSQVLSGVVLAVILLLVFLVAVPEMFGDRPYDPEPSAWPSIAEHV